MRQLVYINELTAFDRRQRSDLLLKIIFVSALNHGRLYLSVFFFKVSMRGSKWSHTARGVTSRYASSCRLVLCATVGSDDGRLDRPMLQRVFLAAPWTCVLHAYARD